MSTKNTESDPYVAMRNELERLTKEHGVDDFLLAVVTALDRSGFQKASKIVNNARREGGYR
jgi:hypothetical protein